MKEFLEKNHGELTRRKMARELDMTEQEVKEEAENLGLTFLDSFIETKEARKNLEMDFELDEMRKRQLQGFIGEKITRMFENRVKEFLSEHTKSSWILKNNIELLSADSPGKMFRLGSKLRKDEIVVKRGAVKHRGASEKEVREKVKEKCFVLEEDLFETFEQVKNPWIDESFYALDVSGTRKVKIGVTDFSKEAFDRDSTIEVELPVVKDFKLIFVEIKTSKGEAKDILSSNQRSARDKARNSAFTEFFSLRVDTEFNDLDIPSSFTAEIEKHS